MTVKEMVESGYVVGTDTTIDYCVQYLKENEQEHYCVVSETVEGGEVIVVEKRTSCDGQQYYEIMVCTLNKTSFRKA